MARGSEFDVASHGCTSDANESMSLVVDVIFILVGIALIPVLAVLFLLSWGQRFPRFGRWSERMLGRVSPRLGRWAEKLLSKNGQRG